MFYGKISYGHELETVKKNLTTAFKLKGNVIDKLFCGQRIVVKKNVDYETARNYRNAFQKTGAECELQEIKKIKKSSGIQTRMGDRQDGHISEIDKTEVLYPENKGGVINVFRWIIAIPLFLGALGGALIGGFGLVTSCVTLMSQGVDAPDDIFSSIGIGVGLVVAAAVVFFVACLIVPQGDDNPKKE